MYIYWPRITPLDSAVVKGSTHRWVILLVQDTGHEELASADALRGFGLLCLRS
jgi:hypothetical protein